MEENWRKASDINQNLFVSLQNSWTVFWDAKGVLLIDFLLYQRIMNAMYYCNQRFDEDPQV